MKRYIQLSLAGFVAVVGLSMTPLLTPSASAINVFEDACEGSGNEAPSGVGGSLGADSGESSTASSLCGAVKQDDAPDIIKNVITTILLILGMVAVIMIIIGGIRYTTSNGDAGSIKGAKDTILYSVIGLVVAILAYAIVNFVVGAFAD